MKKKTILTLFVFISFFAVTGCSNNHKVDKNINKDVINAESEFDNNMEIVTNINATIKEKIYKVILEDNETAQAFAKLLPQDFKMSELNGNEKYVYMNNTLPVNSVNPEQINAGDIMLYENNCLVIFYKTFDTSYSYTKIGHIDNLPDLGNDNISVKFAK